MSQIQIWAPLALLGLAIVGGLVFRHQYRKLDKRFGPDPG